MHRLDTGDGVSPRFRNTSELCICQIPEMEYLRGLETPVGFAQVRYRRWSISEVQKPQGFMHMLDIGDGVSPKFRNPSGFCIGQIPKMEYLRGLETLVGYAQVRYRRWSISEVQKPQWLCISQIPEMEYLRGLETPVVMHKLDIGDGVSPRFRNPSGFCIGQISEMEYLRGLETLVGLCICQISEMEYLQGLETPVGFAQVRYRRWSISKVQKPQWVLHRLDIGDGVSPRFRNPSGFCIGQISEMEYLQGLETPVGFAQVRYRRWSISKVQKPQWVLHRLDIGDGVSPRFRNPSGFCIGQIQEMEYLQGLETPVGFAQVRYRRWSISEVQKPQWKGSHPTITSATQMKDP